MIRSIRSRIIQNYSHDLSKTESKKFERQNSCFAIHQVSKTEQMQLLKASDRKRSEITNCDERDLNGQKRKGWISHNVIFILMAKTNLKKGLLQKLQRSLKNLKGKQFNSTPHTVLVNVNDIENNGVGSPIYQTNSQ